MTTEVINIQIREDGSRVVTRNIDGVGGAADRAAGPVDRLKGLLATLVTGAAVAQLGRLADEYTNLQNRLRLVTTGTENLSRVTKELLGIANQTRSDFTATGELYARLASTTKELGLSQQQLLNFTKQVNQAIVLSGASAQEAAGGLRQLAQGLASGTLRGDELNSVMENFPKVAQIIAEGMGKSIGEIRKLGAEGKITAQAIVEAFASASDQLDQEFGTTVPTLSQSFTVLKNNFMVFIGQLNESTGFTAKLSELIIKLANNLDTIIPILAGVGTAIAVAFSVGPITSFANALKSLYAVAMANPWIALATVIVGVVTSLYFLRDQIKLGIDETTTLGDLMRAVWEDVLPAIQAVADLAAQFFGWLTQTSAGTFEQLVNDIVGYEHESESMWLKLVRIVVQVFDMIGGTIRGVMAGVQAVVIKVIAALMNNFQQLGNAIQGAMNLDGEAILNAVKSNLAGWKEAGTDIGGTFGAAFAQEQLSQADSGLEALLDNYIKRAQEIGRERAAAAKLQGDLNPGGTPTIKPPVDEDAAKKAARALERLKDALRNVLDEADPVGAATRRLAEAQDILNKAVAAGLIDQQRATEVYATLKDLMRDQLDPLAAVNRELDQNADLLRMTNEQAEIQSRLLQITEGLRRDGVILTKEETEALRAKLIVEQELERIARARDSIQANSGGQQLRDFKDQVTAMRELMDLGREGGGLGGGDVADQLSQMLPWANLENTQEQMAAYVQAHADMYTKIAELENQGVINHQTAEMLKAQADQQFLQQRLSYTRQFFGALAGLSSSSNKKLAAIGKAAAIVQATIDGVLAVQKTMAETPYPYNIPLAAAQAALAAANVAQIASQNTAGFRTGGEFTVGGMGGSDSQLVAFRATPGERVQVNTPAQARALEEGGQTPEVVVPVTIVQSDDPQRTIDAMDTAAGGRVIESHMASDPARYKRALGLS